MAPRQTTNRDVAALFVAGHRVNNANGNYYFLPVNFNQERLRSTSVAFTEFKNTLAALLGKTLLFLDTCHAGNVLGGTRRTALDITGVINELASAESGMVVFAASAGQQYSLENEKWGNGAFTKALVEGLGGKADYTKTGRITVTTLDLYLAERVKELTQGQQKPARPSPRRSGICHWRWCSRSRLRDKLSGREILFDPGRDAWSNTETDSVTAPGMIPHARPERLTRRSVALREISGRRVA